MADFVDVRARVLDSAIIPRLVSERILVAVPDKPGMCARGYSVSP